MSNIKKIINDPRNVVPELIEGMVEAYNGRVTLLPNGFGLAKTEIPDGKVALLIGGGSGHEPLFHGYVGDNMADGAACGYIFTSPTPDVILEATRAVHRGSGVLYLYGNYAGDNLNFDMAAEWAHAEGIRVETVRIWDDIASAPPERASERRGVAGDIFVIKIAGAAAATLKTLDEVARVTAKARDRTRSLGVAVKAGSLPESGKATFELDDDEIEIGMGVHGEPGVSREKILPANALTAKMMELLLADLPFQRGDEVCLLLNDLGATTQMELLIVNRKVREILRAREIQVYDTLIGSFATTQEMAGFSITLMQLDDELKMYYNMPCRSLGLTRW
jgi:dihydroxyacetone kinase-like protein